MKKHNKRSAGCKAKTANPFTLPVWLYVPMNFDLDAVPIRYRWSVAWLLSLLHWKWLRWQAEETGDVRLKQCYLRKYIPKRDLPEVLRILTTGKDPPVVQDKWYTKGRCMGYRLTERYWQAKRIECTDARLCYLIRRDRLQARERDLLPVHRWLEGWLPDLQIDLRKAKRLIPTLRKEKTCKMSQAEYTHMLDAHCQKIADGEHELKCDDYGRVHTLLTNLPREIRSCLSLDGEPLVGWDLANSQPLIAGLCARRFHGSRGARCRFVKLTFGGGKVYHPQALAELQCGANTPPDVERYIRVCEQGTFYESLMSSKDNRERIKVRVFAEILFGKERKRSRLAWTFCNLYPSIATMLTVLKGKDHRRAAWLMQSTESTLFIFGICDRIRRERPRMPLYSIHDALFTTAEHADYLRGVIESVFHGLGVRPTLRRIVTAGGKRESKV